MISAAAETFIQETLDGLETLEEMLLVLEDHPTPEQVDDIFRILHTIKGSAAMFGFEPLSRFTHHFETAFDLVREDKLSMSKKLVDTALESRDYMADLLEANPNPERIEELENSELAKNLLADITALIAEADQGGADAAPAEVEAVTIEESAESLRTIKISFKPEEGALLNGMRPDLLMQELADLGTLSVVYDVSDVPPLKDIDPQKNYLTWVAELETDAPMSEIEQVFIFADDAELSIKEVDVVEDAELVSATNAVTTTGATKAPAAQDDAPSRAVSTRKNDTVRIPSIRLDQLMDQLGELVIAQTRLDQVAQRVQDQTLGNITEEVERLVTGLRDATLAMRMRPIETAFGKFKRVVRTLSDELGKNVLLVTEGGETELDKKVIDSLTEPLVHMIRNSIDHGIEDKDRRLAAGKPETGYVFLSARQSGGEVLISVADDGGGLDVEAIRERAIDRGIIAASDDLPDEDLYQMIFEPAFSTAKTLSSVSGRGVGMDAVKKAVTELRGTTIIETLEGLGTRITLRLPVSLAIIDGLLIRVGQGIFVLPLNSVSECVELSETERHRESGRTLLQIRDELVPFLNLDEIFDFPRSEEKTRRVVIVSAEGRRVGFVVDDTLGQHQTVIKTFSRFHRDVEGFAGSTILGDGRVALILDVHALLKNAGSTHSSGQNQADASAQNAA